MGSAGNVQAVQGSARHDRYTAKATVLSLFPFSDGAAIKVSRYTQAGEGGIYDEEYSVFHNNGEVNAFDAFAFLAGPFLFTSLLGRKGCLWRCDLMASGTLP